MVVLFTFVTPAQYVHELGHAAVCANHGYTYEISMDFLGAYTNCHDNDNVLKDDIMFKASGGLLAGLIFVAPVAIKKVREKRWLFIPLVSLSVPHFLNGFIETAFYDSYISGDMIWSALLMMSSYGVLIGLLIKYGRTPQ